jgi:hypothetical protein
MTEVPSKLRGRAVTEMLPRTLNRSAQLKLFNFHCKYPYCVYYKKSFKSAAQSSGCVKIFCSMQQQVSAGVKN